MTPRMAITTHKKSSSALGLVSPVPVSAAKLNKFMTTNFDKSQSALDVKTEESKISETDPQFSSEDG